MKRLILILALVACACPSKRPEGTTGGGTGSQVAESPGSATASGCDAIRAKIEQLYRAEAQAKEPKRVEEAVADNTAMVMADCAKAPAKVVACVNGAATVKDIETTCIAPIDDEGTEGDVLKN